MDIPGFQALSRLASIFPTGPQGPMHGGPALGGSLPISGPNMQMQPEPFSQPAFDVDAEIAKLYQPRYEMQNMAQSMLGNFPQRDTSPSVWRRIGAVLSGMGSENPAQTSDRFLNHHYYNALGDFKQKFDPVSKAADDERLTNQQGLSLARESVTRKQNQMKIDETERKNQATEANNANRTKIMADRAEVYRFKNMNPQWKIVEPKGGFLTAVNPLTNQTVTLKDENGQPIPAGTMNEQDRINLQIEGQMAVAEVRGDEARKTATVQGNIGSRQITERGEQTRQTNAARPTTPAGTTATQQGRALYNKAQQLRIEQPAWARYIQLGSNNTVSLADRTPPEIAKQIKEYLFGTGGGQSVRTPQQSAPSGKILVQSPDGKEQGYIDASELNEAVKNGWKKIGG